MCETSPNTEEMEKQRYRQILDGKCVLVEDCWFPALGAEKAKRKYRRQLKLRDRRNRRRRELRRIRKSEMSNGRMQRRFASDAPLDTEHRLACERRKVLCRSTVAQCPSATDIRVAWHFFKNSYEDRLILGGLMMDLECYLDNSLHRGTHDHRPTIKGRGHGVRGWLRENCPELARKYFTLMRWKGIVRRLRQALEVPDPIPTSVLLAETASASEIHSHDIHVQPWGTTTDDQVRFPWEHGELRLDANGRQFLTNTGYTRAARWTMAPMALERLLMKSRETLQEILATARAAAAKSSTDRHPHMAAIHLCREILRRVNERENWWRGPLGDIKT